LTTPGIIVFDPKSFNPPLDADGDGIYNFTTINIAADVTVKLSGKIFSRPVIWLATGPVTINGNIDLNGDNGHIATNISSVRAPSIPGAGGYSGGVGGNASNPTMQAQPGNGPGGGAATAGGTFTGNVFLVPLVGGSGGGGGNTPGQFGPGGGAGGGALLIASSDSISLVGVAGSGNGRLAANGGCPGTNQVGGGSGGALRLVAPTISGNGTIQTSGCGNGGDGRVRIEAFNHQYAFTNGNGSPAANVTTASPSNVFLPAFPTVRVVSVAGVPVNQSPTGSFQMPDVSINSASPVTVVIEARNIPVGTVVKLHLFSENGADQFVDTTPLAGTSQTSTATASVVFPTGFSRGFVRATWTQ
jgi:hypothetical protein